MKKSGRGGGSALDDSSSIGSFNSRGTRDTALPQTRDVEEADTDDLKTDQGLEKGLFGVLYTLSKEKVDGSKLVGVVKLVLDFLQQVVVLLSADYGWYPWVDEWTDRLTWLWEGIGYLNFQQELSKVSYQLYAGVLYGIGALLLLSLALCAYVGYCFRQHKFKYVWPVWTLRVVTFYVSAMGVFFVSINCHMFAKDDSEYKKGYLEKYPDRKCSDFPQILNVVVAVVLAFVYSLIVFVTTAADFELDPLSTSLLAGAHPHVELINLVAKTVFMLASAVLVVDIPKLQALIFAATMAVQFYTTIRWVPSTLGWVNDMRSGFMLSLTWVSILLVVLKYLNGSNNPYSNTATNITIVTLAGVPVALGTGWLLCFLRRRYVMNKAVAAFKAAAPHAKPKEVFKFWDVYEVEHVARICRTPGKEMDTQDEEAVQLADRILRAGIVLFPASAFAHILYSNLLIEVQNLNQAGQSQLMAAKKLNPGYVDRFAIFVREQQRLQQAHTSTTGDAAVDLMSYVEFQRNYRLLARATQRALTAQQAFWRLLLRSQIRFSQLTASFANIEAAQERAIKTYRMVLDRYPNSVKLLRSYARFQQDVMNNPWRASQIYEKADKLEEQQAVAQDNLLYNNDVSSMLTKVDDKTNAIAVINASGIIQMTNKNLQKLFGYKASELEGQNVSILMPAPYNTRHNGYIAAYISTGVPKVMGQVRELIALHRRRYVFPIVLAVSKLSGQGADSQFLGVIRASEASTKAVRVWVMPNGVTLCVDEQFEDMFGISPADCIGRPFKDLVTQQDTLQELLDALQSPPPPSPEEGAGGGSGGTDPPTAAPSRKLHVQHKYAASVHVTATITRGGTVDEPLYVVCLAPVAATPNALVVMNRTSNIVWANKTASQMLGYAHKSFLLMGLEALLPDHYKGLHSVGMRTLMQRKAANTCKAGQTVLMCSSNRASVPVRLSVSQKAEGDDNLLTVVEATKVTMEAGLDERRVKVEVSPTGEIVAVLSTHSPASLLGVAPSALLGWNLFQLVPEMAQLAPTGPMQEEAVEEMRAVSMDRTCPVYLRVKFGNPQGANEAALGVSKSHALSLAMIPEAREGAPGLSTSGAEAAPSGTREARSPAAPQGPVPQPNIVGCGTAARERWKSATASAGVHHTGGTDSAGAVDSADGHAATGSFRSAFLAAVTSAAASTSGARGSMSSSQLARVAAASADAEGGLPPRVASAPGAPASAASAPLAPPPEGSGNATVGGSGRRAALAPAPEQASLRASPFQSATSPALEAAAAQMTALQEATAADGALGPRERSTRLSGWGKQGVLSMAMRPVILEVDGTSGEANLMVSIWNPDKVATILEVSRDGDIHTCGLDELHPAGPLFGMGPTQLSQFNLRDILGMPAGCALPASFYGNPSGSTKDKPGARAGAGATAGRPSGGSATAKKGAGPEITAAAKGSVGPSMGAGGGSSGSSLLRKGPSSILHLLARHADGKPLPVLAQAIPKRGSSSTFYVRVQLMPNSGSNQLAGGFATGNILAGLYGSGPQVPPPKAEPEAIAFVAPWVPARAAVAFHHNIHHSHAAPNAAAPTSAVPPGVSNERDPWSTARAALAFPLASAAARSARAAATSAGDASTPLPQPQAAHSVAVAAAGGPLAGRPPRASAPGFREAAALSASATASQEPLVTSRKSLGSAFRPPSLWPRHSEPNGRPGEQAVSRRSRDEGATLVHHNVVFEEGEERQSVGVFLPMPAQTGAGATQIYANAAADLSRSNSDLSQHLSSPEGAQRGRVLTETGGSDPPDRPLDVSEGESSGADSTALALRRTMAPLAMAGRKSMRRGLSSDALNGTGSGHLGPSREPSSARSPAGITPPSSREGLEGSFSEGTGPGPVAEAKSTGFPSQETEDAALLDRRAGSVTQQTPYEAPPMHSGRSRRNSVELSPRARLSEATLKKFGHQAASVNGDAAPAGPLDYNPKELATVGQWLQHANTVDPRDVSLDPGSRSAESRAEVAFAGLDGPDGSPEDTAQGMAGPNGPNNGSPNGARMPPSILRYGSMYRGWQAPAGADGGELAGMQGEAGGADRQASRRWGGPGSDDAGSDGNELGPEDAGDGDKDDQQRHADFQRGKRLKRILKVLERPEARRAINRFWTHSCLITVFLLLAHVGCFTGIMVLLDNLSGCVLDLSDGGMALDYMHHAAYDIRVLDQIYKNVTHPELYTPEDVDEIAADLRVQNDMFERLYVERYRRYPQDHPRKKKELEHHWEAYDITLKYVINASDTPVTYENRTYNLFELGATFLIISKNIQANHRFILNTTGGHLSDLPDFRLIHEQIVWGFVDGYVTVLDTTAEDCEEQAQQTNDVMLALLVVEACCLVGAACCYLAYRLIQVDQYRCSLFSVFLAIPSATIKALASRRIDADEDDSDEEDLTGGDAPAVARPPAVAAASADAPAPRSKSAASTASPPGVLKPSSTLHYRGTMPRTQSNLRASFRDHAPPGVTTPADLAAPGPAAGGPDGARTRQQQAGGTGPGARQGPPPVQEEPGDLFGVEAGPDGLRPGPSPTQPQGSRATWSSKSCAASMSLAAEKARRAAKRCKGGLMQLFRQRSRMAGTDKILLHHSLQNWWLMIPLLFWAALIISFYAASYALLSDLYEPIETTNVVSFTVWRNSRLAYLSHELCCRTGLWPYPDYRDRLCNRKLLAAMEYKVLLYGSDHYDRALVANVTMGGVHRIGESSGIIHSSEQIEDLLFFTRECLRFNQSSCFPPGHQYYEQTHGGVNALIAGIFNNVDLLLKDGDAALTLANQHMQFIVSVGFEDARDGLIAIRETFEDTVQSAINTIEALQISLFVVSFFLLAAFVLYMVRPFVRYTREEATHMAKMLSELPPESDITRRVELALGVGKQAAAKAVKAVQPTDLSVAQREPSRYGLVPMRSGSLHV
ncbi:hypothetical protein HYH03_005036 [Edaphochlamys debaryana]|uniref:PAS domain-containing protein n=1 Tax=Edaphochlamys debaryana TaxID=47281 RepID=A0A835Y935_9CHLO|nr:hypothetical protein HYH03_005036 [Edaphochlamys debaryana]|eukprot:KAG2497033.1 hypothetical protein HYH03_005036 [Edaphochlamys debaryana]